MGKKSKRIQERKGKKEFTQKLIAWLAVCGTIVTITGISIADSSYHMSMQYIRP